MRASLLALLLLVLTAPAAMSGTSPWAGWQPESIAAPDAHSQVASSPATATTAAGSPVATWRDADGSVEASVRDAGGHWRTTIVGVSPLVPFVGLDPAGATLIRWVVCLVTYPCPFGSPAAWTGARLEVDGSWTPVPVSPPAALPKGTPFQIDPAEPGLYWYFGSNTEGDGVALGYDEGRQLAGGEIGSLSVSRSRDGGPWDAPTSLLLPHACGGPSSLGPLLGSPSIDDGGSAAGGGVCRVDDGTNVGVTDGPPFLVLMAADGAPSLLPVAIAVSRHTWLETAAFASGGLVFAGNGSHIEVRTWSHAGDLSGPVRFSCAGSRRVPCFADFATAQDGRAVLLFGPDRASSESAAVREASGSWSAPYRLGMHVDETIVGSDIPGFLLVARPGLNGRAAAGYSMVALGADSIAPHNEAHPYVRPGVDRVGTRVRLASRGTWRGAPLPTLRVRWLRCRSKTSCRVISGATALDYTPRAADLGMRLAVQVIASNASGTARAMTIVGKPVALAGGRR